MTIHQLKSWPDFFRPILDGRKTFELRLNDRDYKDGDVLHLREYDDRKGEYTGRECYRTVTYVLEGINYYGAISPLRGLMQGYVIMSLIPHEMSLAPKPLGAE